MAVKVFEGLIGSLPAFQADWLYIQSAWLLGLRGPPTCLNEPDTEVGRTAN